EIYKDMVDVEDTYGNQFVTIPKFYIKKTVTGDVWEWRISKVKKDNDYYLPACFYDEVNSKELPYILVGKYDASETGGKLESKTGVKPLASQTINTFRNYAKANNVNDVTGYQLLDIHALDAIQVLFYIEFATLNSQSKMQGYANANTESIINGTTNAVNASSGSINDLKNGKNAMKYRGIENIYGNIWQFVDGVNINNVNATTAHFYVNRDATTYASDIINGKYTQVGYNKLNTNGWVTKMGYDSANPFIQMPQLLNGNATTKYGDQYWMDTNVTKRVVITGGGWDNADTCGLSTFFLDSSSVYYYTSVGSRLIKTAS
ncbi:MAG: hypothetical protein RR659_02525, partial [Bacilli bacterium]